MEGYKFVKLPIVYLSEGGGKKRDMGMEIDNSPESEDFEVYVEMVNIMLIERYASSVRLGRSLLYMGGESVQCDLSVEELDMLLVK